MFFTRNDYVPCNNCGGSDRFSDNKGGYILCACGAVIDTIRIAAPRYKEVFDRNGSIRHNAPKAEAFDYGSFVLDVCPPRIRKSNSAPYKRLTYWGERLSQWRMREPQIPDNHWNHILDTWERVSKGEFDFNAVDKEFIREILRLVDEELQTTPRFKKKYLEKWLTIRFVLTGKRSYGWNAPQWLCDYMTEMFMQLQIPFDRLVKVTGLRYSFPSLNFCFRRFFDLWGCSHMGKDFPPLKNKQKRLDVILLWLKLIKYLGWPYINNDNKLFGEEFAVDVIALQNGQLTKTRRISRKRQRQRQHGGEFAEQQQRADADSDGFRKRENAKNKGEENACVPPVEAVLGVYDPCGSTVCDLDSWLSYDDHYCVGDE